MLGVPLKILPKLNIFLIVLISLFLLFVHQKHGLMTRTLICIVSKVIAKKTIIGNLEREVAFLFLLKKALSTNCALILLFSMKILNQFLLKLMVVMLINQKVKLLVVSIDLRTEILMFLEDI